MNKCDDYCALQQSLNSSYTASQNHHRFTLVSINDRSVPLPLRLPSSVTMDLMKHLRANGRVQRKKFESIFKRFDHTFSDCEVVDLNELFRDDDRIDISLQRNTTHKRIPKNKRKCRKPNKLVVVANKKFPRYQTRSATKRKCSKPTNGIATRQARKSKSVRKSNGHVKDSLPSPLPNGNTVRSVVWRNKSMFCEPPTVMDINVSNSNDDNISDADANEVSDMSQFCTPPSVIEANPLISRSGFCTPLTVINEKLDENFDQNNEK